MNQANDFKERGNKLFQAQRYEEAVAAYAKAIMHNPYEPTFFTNRALCWINLKQWDRAEDDCRKALEIDKKNVKVRFIDN
jgi:STIP1 homology and U-box containing protein 1